MENVVIIAIVAVIVVLALLYIRKANKSGKKCIGCPNRDNCCLKQCNCNKFEKD